MEEDNGNVITRGPRGKGSYENGADRKIAELIKTVKNVKKMQAQSMQRTLDFTQISAQWHFLQ
jgi:flagellar biosynthesis/type III secretory pathway ATPase